MHVRPFRSLSASLVASLVLLGSASQSFAAGEKDKEVLKLHDQAINEDYLNTDYAKAIKKLNDALKKCTKDACSKPVVAKLYIALGTVQGIGENKLDAAKESFTHALQADPGTALDDSLTTPELTKVFKEAQKATGGGGEEPAKETPPAPETPAMPASDLNHTPPKEQRVHTPVPIYLEVPADLEATKVTVQYKPFGSTKFKTLEMKQVGNGFGAEIPCDDVTTTGDIRYYIIATDADGNPVGTAGSKKDPFKVAIKNEIEGDAPALPGKEPPAKCAAKEDCPPGLPGCPSGKAEERGDKGWGASCEETRECKPGFSCLNGSCEEGGDGGESGGKASSKGKKNVVSLGAQLDLLLINGSDDVCTGTDTSYACFYPDSDEQFFGNPATLQDTNGIQGGFGLAGARVLLGFDRMLIPSVGLSAGLRLGYAFGGSPSPSNTAPQAVGYNPPPEAKSFMPLHAELRLAYHFGQPSAVEKGKLRPYVFVGGGFAQVNASVPVAVCDQAEKDGKPVTEDNCRLGGGKSAKFRDLDAYQITGLNFVGVGAGTTYAITDNFGILAEAKVMFMMTTFGVVIAPNVGPVFAF